jgi:hypothetical protein
MGLDEHRALAIRRPGIWQSAAGLMAAFLVLTLAAEAQVSTGRIIGIVTDPQGAAIAGAKIIVTNTGTNVHWETATAADGSYQVLDLPIGTYSVQAEREGFEKVVTSVQGLEINQSLRVDVRMTVGAVNQVISVESQAAQVETVNPTVGGTVTGAPIQSLPLNGRDTLSLALTLPGVTPSATSPESASGVPIGSFSVAGGRDDAVTYPLDGGDNTSVTYGVPVMNPNPDTVAEFRILDNNYTAEYGRSAGGIVSVVTKSGTNTYHGSAFDYLRNDAFNANTFFNNAVGLARPVLKRNQFGGTLGGPITIPKVVNGRDKLFFFFGYQGQRQNSVAVNNVLTVYTPAELAGNFSGNAGVASFLETHPYYQPNAALAAQGIIDPARIDPVAQAYIRNNLLPVSPTGLLTPNGRASDNRDEYTGKFDIVASSKDPHRNYADKVSQSGGISIHTKWRAQRSGISGTKPIRQLFRQHRVHADFFAGRAERVPPNRAARQ